MRKTLLISSILIATLTLGAIAARPPQRGPGGPGGPGMHRPMGPLARLMLAHRGRLMTLHAELNLTDEQRTAIRDTILSHKSELATAVKPAIEAQRALRDAVLAEKTDDGSAAQNLGAKVGDAAATIAKVKADVIAKANLTPEQQKKVKDFIAASDASVDEFLSKVAEK
jgi:Spy/CpxP family protein refolding chaperone